MSECKHDQGLRVFGRLIRCEVCGDAVSELAAPDGSARDGNWTNINLLNLGEPGTPRWTCHGCCKRMLEALERILRYPVHSEPVGGAMAMQDIAHETLSPNEKAQ